MADDVEAGWVDFAPLDWFSGTVYERDSFFLSRSAQGVHVSYTLLTLIGQVGHLGRVGRHLSADSQYRSPD